MAGRAAADYRQQKQALRKPLPFRTVAIDPQVENQLYELASKQP